MTASGFLHILFFCGQAEKKKEEGPVHLFKSRPHRIPQWRLFWQSFWSSLILILFLCAFLYIACSQNSGIQEPILVGTAALFPAENDKAPDQSVGHPVTEFLWMEMGVINRNDAAAFRPAFPLVPAVRRFDSCALPRGCFCCCHPVGGTVQNFPGNFYNSFLLTILTER